MISYLILERSRWYHISTSASSEWLYFGSMASMGKGKFYSAYVQQDKVINFCTNDLLPYLFLALIGTVIYVQLWNYRYYIKITLILDISEWKKPKHTTIQVFRRKEQKIWKPRNFQSVDRIFKTMPDGQYWIIMKII